MLTTLLLAMSSPALPSVCDKVTFSSCGRAKEKKKKKHGGRWKLNAAQTRLCKILSDFYGLKLSRNTWPAAHITFFGTFLDLHPFIGLQGKLNLLTSPPPPYLYINVCHLPAFPLSPTIQLILLPFSYCFSALFLLLNLFYHMQCRERKKSVGGITRFHIKFQEMCAFINLGFIYLFFWLFALLGATTVKNKVNT